MFDADTLRSMLRPAGDRYQPRSRLVSLEQTTNITGGHVWPLEQMRSVLEVARSAGMRAHLDGARLMNAVVASGVPAHEWAAPFDTAWLDFTKGLGAPVGAVLAGSRELIDEAWRYKQMWGGAMRQAGIVAAAGLYALDHNVERLADDHENARVLAEGLAEIGVDIDPESVVDEHRHLRRARRRGALLGPGGGGCADGRARASAGPRGHPSRRRSRRRRAGDRGGPHSASANDQAI